MAVVLGTPTQASTGAALEMLVATWVAGVVRVEEETTT
jgi:hypothetical protein